jgi:PAS domain S-box-containing protein
MTGSKHDNPQATPARPATAEQLAAENDHLKVRVAVLTAMEQRFRAILYGIGDGVIVTDLRGRVQQMNRAAETLTEWTEAEAAGKPLREVFTIVNEEDRREVANPVEQVLREGVIVGLANRTLLVGRAGTERAVADSAAPVRDATGAIAGVVLIFRDVSSERRADRALRDNERILADILESTLSGYWDWNIPAGTEYLSPAFKKMFGYEDHELPNSPDSWQKLIFAEDLPGVLEVFDRHVKSRGEVPFHNEIRYRHRNGSTVWVICAGRVIEWAPDGTAVRMVGCHVDITSRKRTETRLGAALEELQRSNRDLEQFAYSASHDLQEPLRKVSAFGTLLADECRDALSDEGRKYLDYILDAVNRMRELINDLQTYSRVATQGRAFVRVDLNGVLKDVLSDLELRLRETSGTVEAAELPTIEADPSQMRQLFQNLIGNALKFVKPGDTPRVEVSAETLPADAGRGAPAHGATCRIVVRDHGIGFEQKHAERLFGIFHRLHQRHEYPGSGIGLAVCCRVVERHGGSIEAEGHPGEGAVFTIRIPVRHVRSEEEARP